MLIDWFTVGAQALNFVVLVWLMKRFLYRPVLDAIAAREKRIADQIADAAAKETKAASERKTFEDKNAAFDKQRADLVSKATADPNSQPLYLSDEARKSPVVPAAQHLNPSPTHAGRLQSFVQPRHPL